MENNSLDPRIATQFKIRRARQFIVAIPIVLVLLGIYWFAGHPQASIIGLPSHVVVLIGFAMITGAIIFSFTNWRCPSCNKYLGREINPKFCSKCGTRLR